MHEQSASLYANAAMRALLAREMRALAPITAGIYGTHRLVLCPQPDATEQMPLDPIGATVWLSPHPHERLDGDVRCRSSELPFAAGSFNLLIAQHAYEQAERLDECVGELARVLAPEGVALILGFSPWGTWRPWLAWHTRHDATPLRMRSAHHWRRLLALESVETLQVRFPGLLLPRAAQRKQGDAVSVERSVLTRFGSSWLILARKRRSTLTPLRTRTRTRELAINPRLAPGAQRATG